MNILKLFKKEVKIIKMFGNYLTYNRTVNDYDNLKKEDYLFGFGVHSNHYTKIHEARKKYNLKNDDKLPLRDDFYDSYDNRLGYYIDGTKINVKIHPLHSKQLMNINTKKKYIIDIVSYHHHYGKYCTLLVREEGSKSHKEVLWENISCHCPDFSETIVQNKKDYILIEKFDPFYV